jgi:hypothetical protein
MTAALACQRRIFSSCKIFAYWSSSKKHAVFYLASLGVPSRAPKSKRNKPMFLLSHHFAVIQTVLFHWPLCHRHNNGSRRRLLLHTMLLLSISNLATLCSIAVALPYIGSATIYLQHCRRASNDDDYDGPVPAASSSSSTNCVAWGWVASNGHNFHAYDGRMLYPCVATIIIILSRPNQNERRECTDRPTMSPDMTSAE